LAKNKNNLFQLEALLFGQADLLPENSSDDYTQNLIKEYAFLKTKYGLTKKLDVSRWKLLRLRPDNFPHVRIAQFASLIHSSSKLFSKILDKPEIEHLRTFFACEVSDYWQTHYTFSGNAGAKRTKKLGRQSVDTILINTVVPFLFAYAVQKDNADLREKAEKLLEQIPAERNSVITNWKNIGINCTSAYDTQALLQLKKMYCDEKKCIRCRIGHKVLTTPKSPKGDF